MKRIISFSSHNQQTKKIITQKKKENEIPYCRNKGKRNTILQKQRKTKY
jgi:hypothetical protein